MNKIKCIECGVELTTNMHICQNCGCPVSYSINNNELLMEDKNQYSKIKLYFDFFEYTNLITHKRKTINTEDISEIFITPDAVTGASIYDTINFVLENNKKIKQQIHKKKTELWLQAIQNWKNYKFTYQKDINFFVTENQKNETNLKIAEDVYIETEGNKIKAIKLLKEKINITNDEALNLLNQIYDKYESISFPTIENNTPKSIFSQTENTAPEITINKYSTQVSEPKVKVVSSSSQKSLLSAGIRGGIGGILLGPLGLILGATTAKNKTKTTFVKKGIFGNKKVVTAKNNSKKYKKLAKKL